MVVLSWLIFFKYQMFFLAAESFSFDSKVRNIIDVKGTHIKRMQGEITSKRKSLQYMSSC